MIGVFAIWDMVWLSPMMTVGVDPWKFSPCSDSPALAWPETHVGYLAHRVLHVLEKVAHLVAEHIFDNGHCAFFREGNGNTAVFLSGQPDHAGNVALGDVVLLDEWPCPLSG